MYKENPTISKETIREFLKIMSDIAKQYEKEDLEN
jgi:uncharacterized protein YneF (UPF0154 family)